MLYRLAMVGIVAFWLVMTGLLIRLEVAPEKSTVLDVPVPYVLRVMFKNAQQSLLTLHSNSNDGTAGSVSLRPHITAEDRRSLDFSGSFSIPIPAASTPQRVNLAGTLNMDKALQARDFIVDITLQPQRIRLYVRGDVGRGMLDYKLYENEHLIGRQPLPLESGAIVAAILQGLGMPDTGALPVVQNNIVTPSISSRETRLKIHDEDLNVFQLSLREGTLTVADIYVTQLGQVVLATSSFGYSLNSDDIP